MENIKLAALVISEVRKAVIGKDDVLIRVLLAILSRGHVLLEDIPGVGKTTMALGFSKALDLQFNRVQFTPDVMPSDLTGFSIYNKDTRQMDYQPGALLCNLFLADELNRASSRTQSALLEAMEEGQVTVDGITHRIPQPFLVIATQNPSGASGTQMLPESQLDRFTLRLSIGYPTMQDEAGMVRRKQDGDPLDTVRRVMTHADLEQLRCDIEKIYMADEVLDYLLRLIDATRHNPSILLGASPRATLALTAVSRAAAFVKGRDYVIPEDISSSFYDVIDHRLIYAPNVTSKGQNSPLMEILRAVPAPKLRRAP